MSDELSGRRRLLDPAEVAAGLARLHDWTADPGSITRPVVCATFPLAIRLVDEVAQVAEQLDHHPDIDIRWRTVTFRCSTHSSGGVTPMDFELAHRIDALTSDRG